MQRTLIFTGLVLLAAGLLWPWLSRLPLGRLPGDIAIRGEHGQFFFPATTLLLLSAALSLLAWLWRR